MADVRSNHQAHVDASLARNKEMAQDSTKRAINTKITQLNNSPFEHEWVEGDLVRGSRNTISGLKKTANSMNTITDKKNKAIDDKIKNRYK